MNKPNLFVQTALVITKDKWDGKELDSGKLSVDASPDNFLFYLIELSNSYPNATVVRRITSSLKKFLDNRSDLSVSNLEEILAYINEDLSKLAETGENNWIGRLNAAVGILAENEIALAQCGNVIGYIFRKGRISALSDRDNCDNPHPMKTFTDIVAGKLQKDDQVIFGTSDLLQKITLDRLRSLVQIGDAGKEAQELCRSLKKSKSFGVNAFFCNLTPLPELAEASTFIIDEPEETTLSLITKKLTPICAECVNLSKHHGKKFLKFLSKSAKTALKNWKENYGPKSKELLVKSQKSLSKTMIGAKVKLEPQFEKLKHNKEFKNIKIKTFSYKKGDNFNLDWLRNIGDVLISIFKFFARKENRKYAYLILILLLLSVGYAKVKSNNDRRVEKIKQIEMSNSYEKAVENFKKAKDDLALGKDIALTELTTALDQANQAKLVPADNERASQLLRDINEILDEKTKTVRIYADQPFKLSDNSKLMVLSGAKIFGIEENGKIYLVDTRDKETKLVGQLSTESGQPISAFYSDSLKKVLINTTLNSLFLFDPETNVLESAKVAEDASFEPSKAVAAYSTNVYLLNPDDGEVYKHILRDGLYSKGTAYLDTRKVSIKNAINFAIDGNIFVLMPENKVIKYVKGSPELDFSLKGVPAPNSDVSSSKIYTDDVTNYLYVLDKEMNRVVKFDKSGDFSAQYVFDDRKLDDFVVNTKLQKIWGLSGGQIFEGSL
ncbi:MAG: hypothetical protein WC107_02110 [Patescibacteria group bacterium]